MEARDHRRIDPVGRGREQSVVSVKLEEVEDEFPEHREVVDVAVHGIVDAIVLIQQLFIAAPSQPPIATRKSAQKNEHAPAKTKTRDRTHVSSLVHEPRPIERRFAEKPCLRT